MGYDVSVQYGTNQPEYELMTAKARAVRRGSWRLTQSYMSDGNFHEAADAWCRKHKPRTIVSLVLFKITSIDKMIRVYLATSEEISDHLKNSSNGRGETVQYEL